MHKVDYYIIYMKFFLKDGKKILMCISRICIML